MVVVCLDEPEKLLNEWYGSLLTGWNNTIYVLYIPSMQTCHQHNKSSHLKHEIPNEHICNLYLATLANINNKILILDTVEPANNGHPSDWSKVAVMRR